MYLDVVYNCRDRHLRLRGTHIVIADLLWDYNIFRLDALALSVIATGTWLAGWLGGCLSQPVLYQND